MHTAVAFILGVVIGVGITLGLAALANVGNPNDDTEYL